MRTLMLAEKVVKLMNILYLLINKVNAMSISRPSPQCPKSEVPIYNGSCKLQMLDNHIFDSDTWFDYTLILGYEKVPFSKFKLIGLAKLLVIECGKSKSNHHLDWDCGIL
jgi:hypothetical protein